jgi:hypothetical protein
MTRRHSASIARGSRRLGHGAAAALCAAGLVLTLSGVLLVHTSEISAQAPATAIETPAPTSADASAPAPAPAVVVRSEATELAIESEERLVIPGVLDTELNKMAPVKGVVDPPTATSAYLIDGHGYGSPKDLRSGTSFVAMHTSRMSTGEAVGDALSGPSGAAVVVGDGIYVDGAEFRIVGVVRVAKTALVDSEIWNGKHDLVLVTCQQLGTGTASVENLVLLANRV